MKLILSIVCVLALFCCVDAAAQCKYCDIDSYSNCLACYDTSYNAYVLCTLTNNGNLCTAQGTCNGLSGECRGCVINRAEIRPRPLKLRGEWQLVSVEIKKPVTVRAERRRRS